MKNKYFIYVLKLFSLSFFLFLFSCESSENQALSAGMDCVDKARTTPDATRCLNLVSGLSSEQAYLIRCSANFIAQGFTGKRVADALTDLDENSDVDPALMTLSLFVFPLTSSSSPHRIAKVMENCEKSNSHSMTQLATLALLATTIASVASGLEDLLDSDFDPSNPDAIKNLKDALDQLVAEPEDAKSEEIGIVAVIAHDAYCTDSDFSDTEICDDLGQAIIDGGNDPKLVGEKLLELLIS